MADILNFPDRSRIEEEAGYWLVKLDSGPLTHDEAAELHQWLEADREHRQAIIELSALWDNMDILSELSDLFPLHQTPDPKPVRSGISTRSLILATSAAFSIVLAVFVLFTQYSAHPDISGAPAAPDDNFYRTAVGEQKNITLPDGSVIKLNTDSLVSIDFTDSQRNLYLIRGEAHFKVTSDRYRPFVVRAGNGVVRAVGTAFSVRLKGSDVEVTVTEGRVEIASATANEDRHSSNNTGKDKSAGYLATLDAGQTAEYGDQTIHSVKTVTPEIISRKMSWQHGALVFKGESLEVVVREISRYTDTRIVISDPSLRGLRIGGYFKTGEVETLLTVLKDNFSVNVNRVDDNLVYLTGEKLLKAEKGE